MTNRTLARLLSNPRDIANDIIAWCEKECLVCAGQLADLRDVYPESDESWVALCTDHIHWVRVFVDGPEKDWPGYIGWMEAEVARIEQQLLSIRNISDLETRIIEGRNFVIQTKDAELREKATRRVAKLETQFGRRLELEAQRASLRERLTIATQKVPTL